MAPTGESPLLQAAYDVRRHIGLAVIVGLIVGVGGYVTLGSISSDWQAKAVIGIVDQNTTAVLLDLDPPFPTRSAASVAAGLQEFAKADDIPKLQVLPSDQNRQVSIALDGSSPNVSKVLQTEIDLFIASQLQVFTDQIDSALEAAQGRITDLDKELTAVEALAASGATDDVIRLRRLEVEHDLSDARTKLTDLTTIRGGLQGDLRVVQAAKASEPGAGSVSRVLAPTILALLLGAGAAVSAGRLDSRLRSGARIAAASGGLRLLGLVSPSAESGDGVPELLLALQHVESTAGVPAVLVPLSSQRAADLISSAIESDLVRVTGPISTSSEGVAAAAEGKPIVLVADAEVDRPRHLKQAMQLLSAVGATAEGVVLIVASSTERLRALVDSGNG